MQQELTNTSFASMLSSQRAGGAGGCYWMLTWGKASLWGICGVQPHSSLPLTSAIQQVWRLFREKGPRVSCLEKNSLQGLACPHQVRSSAIYRWRGWVYPGRLLFLPKPNIDPGSSSFCANLFSCQYLSRVEIKLNVFIQLHLLQAGLPAEVGVMPHCCPLSTSQSPVRLLVLWCSMATVIFAHSFSWVRYQNTRRQQIEFSLLIAFI